MAGINGLPVNPTSSPRRNGLDVAGSNKSIVPNSGDSASPTGSKVTARRDAAYGGSNASMMQAAIGGPFGGKTGNSASKTARVDSLPS